MADGYTLNVRSAEQYTIHGLTIARHAVRRWKVRIRNENNNSIDNSFYSFEIMRSNKLELVLGIISYDFCNSFHGNT